MLRTVEEVNGTHKLVYKKGRKAGQIVPIGAMLGSSRGDNPYELAGWREPQHENSSGRIYVKHLQTGQEREFFPHIYDLAIVPVAATCWRANIADNGEITMAPMDFIAITKQRLEEEEHPNLRFHTNEVCWRSYGPRGGGSRRFEEWRANGQLKTWKTRPTDFRLPIKWGLKVCAQLTPREAGQLHFAHECPCDNLPDLRDDLLGLLSRQGCVSIRDVGHHTVFLDLTQVPEEVAHNEQ